MADNCPTCGRTKPGYFNQKERAARILRAVKAAPDGKITASQLAAAAGLLNRGDAHNRLKQLRRWHLIRGGQGVWKITPEGREWLARYAAGLPV